MPFRSINGTCLQHWCTYIHMAVCMKQIPLHSIKWYSKTVSLLVSCNWLAFLNIFNFCWSYEIIISKSGISIEDQKWVTWTRNCSRCILKTFCSFKVALICCALCTLEHSLVCCHLYFNYVNQYTYCTYSTYLLTLSLL